MLDENKFAQYGFPREESDIKGITIHETGNINMNAQEVQDYLNNECRTNAGYHYVVDKNEIVQLMPDDWAVYHTGKGKDFGCRYTIAVSICSSLNDEDYNQAQNRAISLIWNLQSKYHIGNDMVFFHQDFDQKAFCPKTILTRYGTSKNFVYQEIEREEN